MSEQKNFKVCTFCGAPWATREEFIKDPELELVGYQSNFNNLEAGLFLFNHSCGTTIAIPVEKFTDLYNGPIFSEAKTGSDECLGLCKQRRNLQACPVKCECAWVREVLQILKSKGKPVERG